MGSTTTTTAVPVELGVLVGGRGRRMGGVDKGMLRVPAGGPTTPRSAAESEVLAGRLLRLGAELRLECKVVGGEAGYGARFGVPQLFDEPAGVGPLGGLRALLAHAQSEHVVMLACDMPYVSAALLRRLVESTVAPHTALLAAQEPSNGKWHPFFARYRVAACLPAVEAALARNVLSFQTLFRALHVEPLPMAAAEHTELRDWDNPSDVT